MAIHHTIKRLEHDLGEKKHNMFLLAIDEFVTDNIIWPIRKLYQRATRGFDDAEVHDIDLDIAEFLLPRLRRLYVLYKDEPQRKMILQMIEGFELLISENYYNLEDEQRMKIANAFKLLSKYCIGMM